MSSDDRGEEPVERQKIRVRRRRRTDRRVMVKRWLGGVGLVIVLVGLVTGAQAIAARNALEAVRSSLDDARAALATGELERAADRVQSARAAADRARTRTTGPNWWLLAQLPWVGDTPRMVRHVVDVVDPTVTVVEEGIRLGRDILEDDTGLLLRTDDGRFDLAPLERAAATLEQLPVAEVREASAALAAAPDRWVPGFVREGRTETLEGADELLRTIDRGQLALEVAPSLLGSDGPRRYLLVVQNPGELRGTGGIIGFLAELDVQDGAISLGDPEGVDPRAVVGETEIVTRGRFDGLVDDDVDRPEPYAQRYDHIAAGRFLPSTNADPDLPTVAPVVLDIYAQTTGRSLDGVVVIDPMALQRIYAAVGPLQVPSEAAALAPQLPDPIRPERLAEVLLIDTYEVLSGPTEERRTYQTAVATAALEQFLTSPWDGLGVGRSIGAAVSGRNLQVFSRDGVEQAALEELGAAGGLVPLRAGDDLLAVTGNNAAGTKGDVHVAHRLSATIELDRPRRHAGEAVVDQRLTTRVEVESAIDLDSDVYISRALRPQRLGESQDVDPRPGMSRTWFSQWIDGEAVIVSVRDLDGDVIPFGTGQMHGRRVIDHFLETPQGQTTGFQTVVETTLPVEWDGRRLRYGVTFWRQGKAIPDHLDVTLTPPGGWRIVRVEVDGGGEPAGLGPAPEGRPVAARVEGGEVRLQGAMTADTRLVVTLAPS